MLFHKLTIDYDLWEEDGFTTTILYNTFTPCGSASWDNDYNANCSQTLAGITLTWDGDDARALGSFNLNWRNSIPSSGGVDRWNEVEIPVRLGTNQYENWIVKLRYKWTLSDPAVVLATPKDRTLCVGTATTLQTTTGTTNCT